jgi:hypothetical protein
MSDKTQLTAVSEQSNGNGVNVEVTAYCSESNVLSIDALILDHNNKPTIQIPDIVNGFLLANARINARPPQNTIITTNKFINQLTIAQFITEHSQLLHQMKELQSSTSANAAGVAAMS